MDHSRLPRSQKDRCESGVSSRAYKLEKTLSSDETIAFFETRAQLEELQRWSQKTASPLTFVALAPEADYAAQQLDLRCYSIEEFYSEEDLLRLGIKNFDVATEVCQQIDLGLDSCLGKFPSEYGFSASYYFYYIKRLLDTLLHRAYTLASVINRLEPAGVVYFDTQSHSHEDDRLYFLGQSVSSLVLPLLARKAKCKVTQLPAILPVRRKMRFFTSSVLRLQCRQAISWLPGGQQMLAGWRWFRKSRDVSNPVESAMTIDGMRLSNMTLLNTNCQDIGIFESWGARVVHLSDFLASNKGRKCVATEKLPSLDSQLKKLWGELVIDQPFRDLFEMLDIEVFSVVESQLRHFLLSVVPRHLRLVSVIEARLKELSNPVIVGKVPLSVENIACFVAARRCGVPTVGYQHGGFIGYSDFPMMRYTEVQLPEYFLCFGEGVADYVTKQLDRPSAKRVLARPIPVGSPMLDNLYAAHRIPGPAGDGSENIRRVMYVPTQLLGDQRYFSWHIYPEIWYWRLMRDVIRLVCQSPDWELIVKPYPWDWVENPIDTWIQEQKFKNCRVVRDVSFSEVLRMGDMFINDSLGTTLLQALVTDKPVVVFADQRFMHLCAGAEALLRKRVILSKTRDEFLENIAAALQKPRWSRVASVNDEFLQSFGTHQNDGRSADRALKVLCELAERNDG